MMTERQQKLFRKHAIERMEMSAQHAQDWVNFYKNYGPKESLTQWENTLLYRTSLLKAAVDADTDTPAT